MHNKQTGEDISSFAEKRKPDNPCFACHEQRHRLRIYGQKMQKRYYCNRFWRGVPPKGKGDVAFISHMIETALEKEGRVVVVAPHGVLFRGAAEGRIRQKMIEENLLDAVIGMPGNIFPTSNIPVAILVFDRSRERPGNAELQLGNVLFSILLLPRYLRFIYADRVPAIGHLSSGQFDTIGFGISEIGTRLVANWPSRVVWIQQHQERVFLVTSLLRLIAKNCLGFQLR